MESKWLSLSTERSYLHYILDYIYFHSKRHPKTLEAEVQAFFEAAGLGDPHRLDGDGNRLACEGLP